MVLYNQILYSCLLTISLIQIRANGDVHPFDVG